MNKVVAEDADDISVVQDILDNKIEFLIDEFCEKYGIKDMTREPQNRFNACLRYIGDRCFNGTKLLKNTALYDNASCMPSSFNSYDVDKLQIMLRYYAYLCTLYDKVASVYGFSFLTGISVETVYEWGRGERKINIKSADLYKQIISLREFTLREVLITGKRNIGPVVIANDEFKMNLPGVSKEPAKPRLSNAQIAAQIGAAPASPPPAIEAQYNDDDSLTNTQTL